MTGIAGSTAAEAAAQRPEEKPREPAAPSSGICAVLGPSGAGKTTLIDILAGRKRDAGALSRGSVALHERRLALLPAKGVDGMRVSCSEGSTSDRTLDFFLMTCAVFSGVLQMFGMHLSGLYSNWRKCIMWSPAALATNCLCVHAHAEAGGLFWQESGAT